MFRRSIWELTGRRSIWSIPGQLNPQRIRPFVSSSNRFSASSQQNGPLKVGSNGKPDGPKSSSSAIVLGSAVVAGAALLAYQSGYLDKFAGKHQQPHSSTSNSSVDHRDAKETPYLGEKVAIPISKQPDKMTHTDENVIQKFETQTDITQAEAGQKIETRADLPHVETEQKVESPLDVSPSEATHRVEIQMDVPDSETPNNRQVENQSDIKLVSDVIAKDGTTNLQEKHELEASHSLNAEEILGVESPASKATTEPNEGLQFTQLQIESAHGKGKEEANLLDAYHLTGKAEESSAAKGAGEQALVTAIGESDDGSVMVDGKLVVNFLQAIHAAERRQAELDALAFAEEQRALKDKYEKELRDLRARELMRAEEAAILDKEIKRERAKAAAAIRALEEKMEEKLRVELEQKDTEAEMKLKKIQELAKVELAAALASEKAAQIEKMADANLNIDALCMAFYARSEEARQIRSVHKLALGALALEDALTKGLPIQQELDALNPYLEGVDKDSLLCLVLSSLPEETRQSGTDTLLQLNQKFGALKGTLRHYILIPPGGGGGISAHALAQIASWLRIKEVDPAGDGIESVIGRVESFLAEGKLAEAADALQEGVRGSQAEEIAGEWVRRARNRAITEQALSILQSYATSISLTQ